MKKSLITLVLVLLTLTSYEQKIVILGSSTAAGVGPSAIDSAWVWRYTAYLASNYPAFTVTNLAASGYATAQVLPSGDANRNITKALSLSPSAIIVNLPTNDTYNGVSVTTQLANYRTIYYLAKAANVPMWICTPQPRDYLTSTQIQMQRDVMDSINSYYGNFAIDFWSTIAASNGDILTTYWIGDGIHLNEAGHRILYNRVIAENIPNYILNPPVIYYVSTSGNDSNNGLSTSAPWRTLTKVSSVTLNPGNQVLFKKGDTWTGDSLVITHSGTNTNPIILGAYGTGANPLISGFTTVPAWTNMGSNIWQSTGTVSTLNNCNIVTINGVNMAMGRYPKTNNGNGGYLTFQSHSGSTSITSSNLTGTPNWSGTEVVIRTSPWTLGRDFVTSQSGSTIYFTDIGVYYDDFGFFFQNSLSCCTQQDEWFYNHSTKKLSIYSSSQPVNVKVSSIEKLLNINGASYININGVNFEGANGVAIYDRTSNVNINISNCTISNIGVVAIYQSSNNSIISNDSILNVNTTAIGYRFGRSVNINNNYIANIGTMEGMRLEIFPYYGTAYGAVECEDMSSVVIQNNTIYNTGYNGINFYGDTALIKNNFINTYCTILEDGGGIYSYSGAGRTSVVRAKIVGNICINGLGVAYGASFRSGAAGIYLDEQSKNFNVYDNSIANTQMYGIQCNVNAGSISFHNNTIYNGSNYQLFESYSAGAPAPTFDSIYNNILVAKYSGQTGQDWQKCLGFWWDNKNSVDGKTVFVNSHYLNGNYYARPIADDNVVVGNGLFYTLPQWKTFSGKETTSRGSPQAIFSVNDLQFVYNATNTPATTILTNPMIDVKGVRYSGSITLAPFTSVVLIKDASVVPRTVRYGKPILNNRKVIIYK